MKYFTYALIAFALGLLIYNFSHLDFNNITSKDSKTALIGVFASACVVLLMCILEVAKKIQNKQRN